ncbi:MAG: D-alanine--D-alanine ligase [Deltaproteobacteria bacterium]|nr:D-alanine--D-alanine ligase [Deltaproteobacteria bacterium]
MEERKKLKVAVVFGGVSTEHEVSLASAYNILNAIDREKYDVVEIGMTKTGRFVYGEHALPYLLQEGEKKFLPKGIVAMREQTKNLDYSAYREDGNSGSENELMILGAHRSPTTNNQKGFSLRDIDVLFPVMHGAMGEDGAMQGLCRIAGIPVVGCDVLASAVAMDKITTNTIGDVNAIPQAKWFWYPRRGIEKCLDEINRRIEKDLGGYPAFVKPSNSGSSVGVCKIHYHEELAKCVQSAAQFDNRILFEQAIKGREIELGVLGEEEVFVSTVAAEILPGHEFYDYEAKYIDDSSEAIIPAVLPAEALQTMRSYAEKIFYAIDGTSMARVDFFYDEQNGNVYFNEVNTIPGFTQTSMYPLLMKASGISYSELVDRMISWSLRRAGKI